MSGEYFGDVHYLQRQSLPANNAVQMHEARHVSGGYDFSAVALMISEPILTHRDRNVDFAHSERATETTAFILAIEFDKGNVL